jgi:hypothetical protein
MKKEARKAIMRRLDTEFVSMLERFAMGLKIPEAQKRASLRHLQKSPGYMAIRKTVENAGDNTADVDEVTRLIRTKLFPAIRKEAITRLRALPHGVGGHPPKLSFEQKKRVLAEILELIRSGKTEKSAIADVATKYDVSYRTMQRAWQKRTTPP